jgi:hypothetical protein
VAAGVAVSLFGRAKAALLGRRIAPADVRVPDGVTVREGRLIPAIGGWLARMGQPAAAVTLRRTIIVHPGATLTRRLLLHELEHVRQWREDPLFPLRYTTETLRNGYWNNRYEQQAREAETSRDAHPLT